MQATRRARLESVLLEELSTLVAREIKDPRVPPITFTAAEVTSDGSQATLYVSLLGGPSASPSEEEYKKKIQDCLTGLGSASGYMRRHLARVLDVRYIPQLIFKEDRGLENASRVYDL